LNGDLGGNFQGVQITSGLFQIWRAAGMCDTFLIEIFIKSLCLSF
jgi:photosystem I P700 chlorophyll a apoprotein A1